MQQIRTRHMTGWLCCLPWAWSYRCAPFGRAPVKGHAAVNDMVHGAYSLLNGRDEIRPVAEDNVDVLHVKSARTRSVEGSVRRTEAGSEWKGVGVSSRRTHPGDRQTNRLRLACRPSTMCLRLRPQVLGPFCGKDTF